MADSPISPANFDVSASPKGIVPEIHLFLSYASEDGARALAIADALAAAGVRVWIDRRGIAGGTAWAEEIVAAVRACNVVAVLCSAASMGSRNVRQELQLAWDCDRPILPLLLERVQFPDTVAYFLQGRQWVEILDRPEEAWTRDLLVALAGDDDRREALRGDMSGHVQEADLSAQPGQGPHPGNLPVPPTPILGRTAELKSIVEMLLGGGARLVTLTGPGGVGKTRLALEAAALVRHAFPDGVWNADLSAIRDAGLVVPTIARALEVREEGDRPLRDRLAAFLQGKRLLLLLDNFEQVAAAGPAVADILSSSPSLTVLATSRMPLRLRAEREVAVLPLGLPDAKGRASAASVARVPAVALFLERASAAKPTFALTADNAAAVAEICRRLDGLPLAIELAAARVRMLPPSALLTRLEDRFKLLACGALDLPERQRTMRDAVAWSHDLLDPRERPLFRRLSVFAGSFDLESTEAVTGQPSTGELDLDVLDGLELLVGHSLLRQEETPEGELRFSMLTTIRDYGLERLAESGEAPEASQRHADFFLALAELLKAELTGPNQHDSLQRLEAAHDDLRAALAWSVGHAPEIALRLGGALWRFWYVRGYVSEGRRWLDQAIAAGADAAPAIRAVALDGACRLVWAQGDYARALPIAEESLTIHRELGDRAGIASALSAVAGVLSESGDFERTQTLLEEELTLRRGLDDPRGLGLVLANLAGLLRGRDDFLEDRLGARAYSEEALGHGRRAGDQGLVAFVTIQLALMDLAAGQIDRARAAMAEALMTFQRLGDRGWVASVLAGLSAVAVQRGRPERAARLLGSEAALRESIGAPIPPVEHGWYERLRTAIETALGEAEFTAARTAGASLPLDEAVAEALMEAEQPD